MENKKHLSLKLVLSYSAMLLLGVLVATCCFKPRYVATTHEEELQQATQDSVKFQSMRADMDAVPKDTLQLVK